MLISTTTIAANRKLSNNFKSHSLIITISNKTFMWNMNLFHLCAMNTLFVCSTWYFMVVFFSSCCRAALLKLTHFFEFCCWIWKFFDVWDTSTLYTHRQLIILWAIEKLCIFISSILRVIIYYTDSFLLSVFLSFYLLSTSTTR